MLNKIVLMGRLTADPELKKTQSDVATCKITVAVDRDFTPKGQEKQADFISVVAWRQTAEFISKYFSKGRMITVEGGLRTGSYEDKNGTKHYTTDVYADKVYFCGDKSDKPQQGQQTPQKNTIPVETLADFEEIIGDDELPF